MTEAIRWRAAVALKEHGLTIDELVVRLGVGRESLKRTIRRYAGTLFIKTNDVIEVTPAGIELASNPWQPPVPPWTLTPSERRHRWWANHPEAKERSRAQWAALEPEERARREQLHYERQPHCDKHPNCVAKRAS